jgi:hypothetical protein
MVVCLGHSFAHAVMASPLQCSSVLLEVKITQAVEELAQMRMGLDLAKSGGENQTPAAKSFEKQFPAKYQELLQVVKSDAELKKMIQARIHRLQKADRKKEEIEVVKREQEQATINVERKFVNRFTLPSPPTNFRNQSLEYLPKVHTIMFQERSTAVALLDVTTNTITHPLSTAYFAFAHVLPSGDKIAIINYEKILVYDVGHKKFISEVALQKPKIKMSASQRTIWNPSNTKVAFTSESGDLATLDLATGSAEVLLSRDQIKFGITETDIALINYHAHHLIVNSVSKQTREVTNTDLNATGRLYLQENGVLTFARKEPFGVKTSHSPVQILDNKNLNTIDSLPWEPSLSAYQNSVLKLDTEKASVFFTFEKNGFGAFDSLEFSEFYGVNHPSTIEAISLYGKHMVVMSSVKDPSGNISYHIDLWSTDKP